MAQPLLVGDCVAAMRAKVKMPVTVKCRIGIDDQDPEEALEALACALEQAGVAALIVTPARLGSPGSSRAINRDIPPLDYDRVYRLKAAHSRAGHRARMAASPISRRRPRTLSASMAS